MHRIPSVRRAMIAAPMLCALLAGCISFGGKAPAMLLTLQSAVQPAANVDRTGTAATALAVQVPMVPQKLRTPRLPVVTRAGGVAYLKDAQWVEAPARLFQRLLVDTLASRSNRLVLDDSEFVTGAGETLSGELVDFGVDESRSEAIVIYQALRMDRGGATIAQRRFEAREPVGAITPASAGAALNRAANHVAADVAGWMEN